MTRLAGIDIGAPPAVVVPLFLLLLLIVAAAVGRFVGRLARRWLSGRAPGGDHAESAADAAKLGVPVAVAVLTGGLLLLVPELQLPGRIDRVTMSALTVALVASCALALSRIAVAAVTEYAARHPSVTPALGVARVATRVAFAAIAAITALQSLGVPVTPLLTTLGIGSLAVALALQDTLANFFAGLYLLADRPVRSGDYIKIHDGEEGYVEAIGWRSSRLRTLKNNTVIVPNQKLSQAILTNYHLPQPPVAMGISITVPYDADPEAVEAQLGDEMAKAIGQIPEIHGTDFAVRLTDFAESGMVFTCGLQVRDIEAQYRAGHELRKRLLTRLRHQGIQIPYPQRVLHTATPADPPPPAPRPPSGKA
jgi:small-conductance mechanosensitive channel